MEEQYTRREISYALSALTDVEYEIIKDMKIDGIYKALSSRENLDQSLDLCRQVVQQYEDTVAVYKARMNTLEKLNTILAAYKEHVEKMNASNKIKNERERIEGTRHGFKEAVTKTGCIEVENGRRGYSGKRIKTPCEVPGKLYYVPPGSSVRFLYAENL